MNETLGFFSCFFAMFFTYELRKQNKVLFCFIWTICGLMLIGLTYNLIRFGFR